MEYKDFRTAVYSYYRKNRREFSFRNTTDPYKILVSEIMLQQTGVFRVEPKFDALVEKYPDMSSLASADLGELLGLWKGLGYNRRAIYLRDCAGIILAKYKGRVPEDPAELMQLPGIGPATACSIPAFAYNIPTVFLEINIRRVFLFFFFTGRDNVADKEILPLVEDTLDRSQPREWYYALMDYGTMLKSEYPELAKSSRHYAKQKPFQGSNRQVRGQIVGYAAEKRRFSKEEVAGVISCAEKKLDTALTQLEREGFLNKIGDIFIIAD